MIEKSRSEIEQVIDEWILNERNRSVIKRRMCDGITYERIAEEFELSPQQIKNIIYKSKEIIARHL